MDSVGDVITQDHWGRRTALRTDGRVYSHHDLYVSAHRVESFLSYLGVEGDYVDVYPELAPEPILTFFAAAYSGAVTDFDPPSEDAQAVLVPVDKEDEIDQRSGLKIIAYGGDSAREGTYRWNPDLFVASTASGHVHPARSDTALRVEGQEYSHGEILDAAERIADEYDIDEETEVAVRAPIGNPGTITAGIVAPLMKGGSVLLETDDLGDIGVGEKVNDPVGIDPADVF